MDAVRVLLLANTLPPRDVSGVGEQVLQLAAGLRETGCEVEVLGRGPDAVRGPKVLFPLFAVPAVWRALRRFRPHVVQVHESDGGLAALLVAAVASRLDPPPRLVALLQVSYVEERRAVRPLVAAGRVLGRPGGVERRFRWLKAPLHIALGRLTARTADVVLTPSAATGAEIRRDYLKGWKDAESRSLGVLPNVTGGLPGVAVETVSEEPGYLLFVGRLRIRKGVEVLLEAMRALRATHPGARLLVAGDGEHRAALERRAAELDLNRSVLFLGRCDAGRVRGLLRGARALVVPSIYEGMPLVVLEAMEAGLPVIASRVSGIPEVVTDGGLESTGWLVPPEDPERLTAALAEAMADPGEARRRGEAGRRRVDNEFRPAHAAAQWRAAVLAGRMDGKMQESNRVDRGTLP